MKGLSIPLDTNGNSVSLILRSSDGGNTTLGPFTTTAAEKTEVAVAIPPPFVGHEFQIVPANNANCRVWWEQTKAHYDLYPELTPEYTSIMEMGGPDAKFVQGILLTGDSNNTNVSFQVLYDGGQSGPTFSGVFNGKQTKPFSFATPFVAHDVQIVPANSVRIFVEESKWVYQPTPELAQNWITQGTAHGMTGYQHVQKIEAAWSSNANVTLAITSFDGTSPQTITLPSTGGNYQKQLFFCTFNKGQLYQYSAISNNNFQIFENDFT